MLVSGPFTFRELAFFIFYFCVLIIFVFLVQEKIGSWYSNPGTGTTNSGAGGGGVGKYLKSRNAQAESVAVDTNVTAITVAKKRKLGASTAEFKDFSAW